jgi:hypothetical protein
LADAEHLNRSVTMRRPARRTRHFGKKQVDVYATSSEPFAHAPWQGMNVGVTFSTEEETDR